MSVPLSHRRAAACPRAFNSAREGADSIIRVAFPVRPREIPRRLNANDFADGNNSLSPERRREDAQYSSILVRLSPSLCLCHTLALTILRNVHSFLAGSREESQMHRKLSSARSDRLEIVPSSCGPTQNRPSLLFVPTWWTDLIASTRNDTEGTNAKGIFDRPVNDLYCRGC